MKTILVISDLHLSRHRPDITKAFYLFLETEATKANHLMILGDLFEMWLGDDLCSTFHLEVAEHLKALSEKGCSIGFIHGNRDFLLGAEYAKLCGMKILPEFYLITHETQKILFCHGDQLCTLDRTYQKFRKIVRNRIASLILRHLPKMLRNRIGKNLRQKSQMRRHDTHIDKTIYQANPLEIDHKLKHYKADYLIYGHIHQPQDQKNFFVLSDWDKKADYLKIILRSEKTMHSPIEIKRYQISII